MDRDKWVMIGLFLTGVSLIGVGDTIIVDVGTWINPGTALSIAGGAVLGLAGIIAFRWQTGSVSRRRAGALVGSFLVVGVGSVVSSRLIGGEINEGFPLVFVIVFIYWLDTLQSETPGRTERMGLLGRTDERMRLLAYKAAYGVLVALIVVAGLWLWLREVGIVVVSAETMIAVVGAIALFGWLGAYRYLQTHN
ncbi:hypothetical protein [Halorhabdus salina]|uniref:hypothetical protein n=1 Tax=Halorhabdus salina TaxID=2750670 RepID=UPI0015EE3DF2|nr:hypothetical protein [Halorhabdus salina]